MSLVELVLAAQRERETVAELGTPEQRRCKAITCTRKIIPRNKSGYCYKCRHGGSGRRWFERESRQRRKAEGRCAHHCGRSVRPDYSICDHCLEQHRARHQKRKQKPGWKAKQLASRKRYVARCLRLGRCPQCGKDKGDSQNYICGPCLIYMRAIRTAYAQRKRAKAIEADRARSRELLAQIPGRAA